MKSEPWKAVRYVIMYSSTGVYCGHTRNDIASIHSILVLDKAEAIHELDLGDLSRAMSVEVGFDISLSS
jgi:hypothetical protein